MSADRRPLFMIGIAAELAGMHPQTLRVYERRGLVSPRRTARNTRLYSEADVARLRRIQELSESGLNLAGIERVMDLERRLERVERRLAAAQSELDAAGRGRPARAAWRCAARCGAARWCCSRAAARPSPHRYPPVIPT